MFLKAQWQNFDKKRVGSNLLFLCFKSILQSPAAVNSNNLPSYKRSLV